MSLKHISVLKRHTVCDKNKKNTDSPQKDM